MRRTALPPPPNPSSPMYAGKQLAWARDAYAWMQKVKAAVDADSAVNTRPTGQFLVTTYTAVNTMTGTDALSNLVATLINDMMAGGYLTTPRNLS